MKGAFTKMNQTSNERANLYTTRSDFCRIFRDDMQSLYLLALVLTADQEKAEQCFLAGLDDCASGNQVFKEWAHSWARRAVIKNAIRSIAAVIAEEDPAMAPGATDSAEVHAAPADLDLPAEISALLELPARERFAFVMSFCEGYSDQECALLLGCRRESLVAARLAALKHLNGSAAAKNELRTETPVRTNGVRHSPIDLALSARSATFA
jgi:DNA-directed RNA polymerase specialized sigma24 family protein